MWLVRSKRPRSFVDLLASGSSLGIINLAFAQFHTYAWQPCTVSTQTCSLMQVLDIFQKTQAAFPGAEVFTSTLDDFTLALQAALPELHSKLKVTTAAMIG